MDEEYMKGLEELKESFQGKSETCHLANIISTFINGKRNISILDIGTGNAKSLNNLSTILSRNSHSLTVTAIDLYKPTNLPVFPTNVNFKFLVKDIIKYSSEYKYDIVTATQSIYYFDNFLNEILNHIKKGGLIAITVWSENCILRKIAEISLGGRNNITKITAECVSEGLDRLTGEACNVYQFKGLINIHSWLSSEEKFRRIISIITRGRVTKTNKYDYDSARKFIISSDPIQVRCNGIVYLKIPNCN